MSYFYIPSTAIKNPCSLQSNDSDKPNTDQKQWTGVILSAIHNDGVSRSEFHTGSFSVSGSVLSERRAINSAVFWPRIKNIGFFKMNSHLNVGMKCIKYMLSVANFMFVVRIVAKKGFKTFKNKILFHIIGDFLTVIVYCCCLSSFRRRFQFNRCNIS